MKHNYIIIVFIFFCIKSWGTNDSCNYNKGQVVRSAMEIMIDTMKSPNNRFPNDTEGMEVYIVRFYHLEDNKKDFCFTIGYIVNSSEYVYLKASYYFKLGKEIVLVRAEDTSFIKDLEALGVVKLDYHHHLDEIKIVQRLYPRDVGFMTYQAFGMTVFLNGCNLLQTYHSSSNDIPDAISVYDHFPKGTSTMMSGDEFIKSGGDPKKLPHK